MKQRQRLLLLVLATALMLSIPAAAAGIYHAPVLTLLVPFAPGDMSVTLTIYKNDKTGQRIIPVKLEKQRKGWETQYMLRREAVYGITTWYGNAYDLKDATVTLEYGGENHKLFIPQELLSERNSEDYIQLNWRSGRMTAMSSSRSLLLALMWTAIALAVEGIIFWLFGYRSKKSWIMFLIINTVTQTAHHAFVSGVNVNPSSIKVYALLIPVLLLVEMVCFVVLIDEYSRDKTISYVVAANAASQAALGLLMSVLPT
ncbi:MAG: hypothetical protein J5449_03615 [Oscillospiraceae bacterium]|nr:hypothetical protein [Oscillospiraceae bacterium]